MNGHRVSVWEDEKFLVMDDVMTTQSCKYLNVTERDLCMKQKYLNNGSIKKGEAFYLNGNASRS